MESDRARAILQMIQDRQEASVQPSEREELVSQGFLVSVDAPTRDGWTASVAGLAALRDRVREMSRVALATPGPVAPPELQQMVASLEELTRQKPNLETRVWNAPTQEYFLPTLAGRNVLADLTTWQRRLDGRTFPDFLREMYDYRAALFGTVSRASAIQGGLLWDEETRDAEETPLELSFTNVDFRFAAMILAKRGINSSLLVSAFQMFHHDTNWGSLNKVDRLIGSAILASLPWDPASVRNAFERLRVELEYHGVQPEDRILAAASLADLPQSAWAEVLGRIDDLHRGRPNLNFLLASALARSPYETAEPLPRFPPTAPHFSPLAPLLYVLTGHYVYRPIRWYIPTHSVHVHTVAAFG